MEILVYSAQNSPRFQYILKAFSGFQEELVFNSTSNKNTFTSYNGPSINYGLEEIKKGELKVNPHGLLFEKNIKNIDIQTLLPKKIEASPDSFDVFAASFYLLSFYNEYLIGKKDALGRVDLEELEIIKRGWQKKPIVHIWLGLLLDVLGQSHPGIKPARPSLKYFPTIDVDSIFAFRGKGFLRTLAGTLKDLVKSRFNDLKLRLLVLAGIKPDPFFNFDDVTQLHLPFGFKPTFFFHVGQYGKYDKNIPTRNRHVKQIIKQISKTFEIGLHPSYASNFTFKKLTKEHGRLTKLTGKNISMSRQHFLWMHLPSTYRNLIKLGVERDFTAGFATAIGFRNGVCMPFQFYDLTTEEETKLEIWPFQYMEVALKAYMGLSPGEALEEIKILIDETWKVGGTFVSLWHNESLSSDKRWIGWKDVYKEMLAYIHDKISKA